MMIQNFDEYMFEKTGWKVEMVDWAVIFQTSLVGFYRG